METNKPPDGPLGAGNYELDVPDPEGKDVWGGPNMQQLSFGSDGPSLAPQVEIGESVGGSETQIGCCPLISGPPPMWLSLSRERYAQQPQNRFGNLDQRRHEIHQRLFRSHHVRCGSSI